MPPVPGSVGRPATVAELLLLAELARIGNRPPGVPLQLVEHQPAGFADAEGVLEQIDERLSRQGRRRGCQGRPQQSGGGKGCAGS